ncbi:hypothetical protein [Virgibacillus chiguensis]|uniref:YesK-like protein n=1 Tax=Virgibacillus chiguensis TaxID=411959 RepID=A0A1M5T018_9BACI|nr:hypothetical protein [Virgibacillus chiguensis]SHH43970.1 hypothetical protein SAMN05421807_10764 [Virgibacillus chiguensis]
MEGVDEFIVLTLIHGCIIYVLSMLLKDKKIVLPIICSLLSMILLFVSFKEAGFSGMNLAFIGTSALIASIINMFIISIIMFKKDK